jgi:hypothetical protein
VAFVDHDPVQSFYLSQPVQKRLESLADCCLGYNENDQLAVYRPLTVLLAYGHAHFLAPPFHVVAQCDERYDDHGNAPHTDGCRQHKQHALTGARRYYHDDLSFSALNSR